MPFISLVAELVKNAPTMQETWVRSLGREDPLEKGTASSGAFQMALVVKNPPASAGDMRRRFDLRHRSGRSPGGGHGNPLGIFVWRIPRTEQPGGLQSMGSQRIGHD